jgi:hypothetical protein
MLYVFFIEGRTFSRARLDRAGWPWEDDKLIDWKRHTRTAKRKFAGRTASVLLLFHCVYCIRVHLVGEITYQSFKYSKFKSFAPKELKRKQTERQEPTVWFKHAVNIWLQLFTSPLEATSIYEYWINNAKHSYHSTFTVLDFVIKRVILGIVYSAPIEEPRLRILYEGASCNLETRRSSEHKNSLFVSKSFSDTKQYAPVRKGIRFYVSPMDNKHLSRPTLSLSPVSHPSLHVHVQNTPSSVHIPPSTARTGGHRL